MAMMIHADTAESSSIALLPSRSHILDRALHSLLHSSQAECNLVITWIGCGKATSFASMGDDVVKASLSH